MSCGWTAQVLRSDLSEEKKNQLDLNGDKGFSFDPVLMELDRNLGLTNKDVCDAVCLIDCRTIFNTLFGDLVSSTNGQCDFSVDRPLSGSNHEGR